MALAMKTACFGKPLRTVCLFLLYFNLIIHAWGLWSWFRKLVFLEYVDFIGYLDIFLKMLGCSIFLSVIVTIYRDKPSLFLLAVAIWSLCVHMAYLVYSMIVSIVNGSAKRICYYVLEEKAMRFHDETRRDQFIRWIKTNYTFLMILANVLLFGCVVFELYTALVCYSYREDLKRRPAFGRPPRQINIDDKEADISTSYPSNTQFVTLQNAIQPANYPISSPKCHDHPAQDFYQPSQYYPQAPPPYQIACK